MNKQKTRWAIYQCGYVTSNGNITDDFIICIVDEKPQHVRDDNFAIQQQYDGIEYVDIEDSKIIGPYFLNKDKTVECKLCFLQDHTNNRDLDSNYHLGFTIGNGKQLYWDMLWGKNGNATVFSKRDSTKNGRHVSGDVIVKIHFK